LTTFTFQTPTKSALYASRQNPQNREDFIAVLVDVAGIYDYLSEIRRGIMANPLTINVLFSAMSVARPQGFAVVFGAFSRIFCIFATLFGLTQFIGGCVVSDSSRALPAVPAMPVTSVVKPTALTSEAEATLQAAEQSVIEARIKRSLWTAAVEQLRKARAAAQQFDSVATLEHAKEVVALCGLSIKQLELPPVKW
jgi:hypothetical protein